MAVALEDQLPRPRVEARVELWMLAKRQRRRFQQEARQGERDAVLLGRLEASRHHGVEVGDVGLVEVRDVGNESRGQGHALGDGAAEVRERLTVYRPPLVEPRQRWRLEPDGGQRLGG